MFKIHKILDAMCSAGKLHLFHIYYSVLLLFNMKIKYFYEIKVYKPYENQYDAYELIMKIFLNLEENKFPFKIYDNKLFYVSKVDEINYTIKSYL